MITQANLPSRPRTDVRAGVRTAALGLCLTAAAAQAGSISITMTTTPEVRDGAIDVHLTVRNSGDEAASSVVPILRFGDRERVAADVGGEDVEAVGAEALELLCAAILTYASERNAPRVVFPP